MTAVKTGGRRKTTSQVERVLRYNSNGFEFTWTRGSQVIYVKDNEHETPFYAFDAPEERSVVAFHKAVINHCRSLATNKDRREHVKIKPYTWARVLRSLAKEVYK